MKATQKTRRLPAILSLLALTAAWTVTASAQLMPPPPAPTMPPPPAPMEATEPAPAPAPVVTAAELLANLEFWVAGMTLSNSGTKNSLMVKLGDARSALANDDIKLTLSHLKAFTNHVSAQSGKHLTKAQASDLLVQAEAVVAKL